MLNAQRELILSLVLVNAANALPAMSQALLKDFVLIVIQGTMKSIEPTV